VAVLIGIVMVLAAIGFVGACVARRRRSSSDLPALPDDWWPSFERDFQDYARRVTRLRQDSRRREGGRRPTGR
jgi:hypothetical protein